MIYSPVNLHEASFLLTVPMFHIYLNKLPFK
jgi:hypothetical protein